MRFREFNFAIAIAVSIAAHLVLWPVARRLTLPPTELGGEGSRSHGMPQVTLVLNEDGVDLPRAALPPKPPEESPEDNMGEAKGKGTGAQEAKGDQPLQARQADQDQAFLGKHQPGSGRENDLPIPNTDPRGQDGIGGQRGRPQVAQTPPTPSQSQKPSPAQPAPKTREDPNVQPAAAPRPSPIKQPDPVAPTKTPADAVTPPESKTASTGAAKADVNKKPVDGVKPTAPVEQTATKTEGIVPAGPKEGPPVKPVTAISTAPPTPGASVDRQSVVVAPKLPLRPEVVVAPPPPAVEESKAKTKTPVITPAKAPTPPVQIASAAPALVGTGDGRAPGRARPSADPSQLSDTESDPFSKHSVTAVLRDGKLQVRDGRKVKTTRPHFLPGAFADFIGMQDPKIVLMIEIDTKGNVVDAKIKQGTGSISIDLPCQRAVYEWWFEPAHDAKGLPKPDSIEFTIQFR